nr:DUF6515 family protein [Polymorphobacter sp.]
MTMKFKTLALLGGAAMFTLTSVAEAGPNRPGPSRAGAKSSVNHGGGGGGGNRGGGGGGGNRGGGGGHNNINVNHNNNVNVNGGGGRNGYNNGRGNTVVVAPGRGGGYNNNYNNGHWDNDDNDFLEFVGKTAAITAGVSVVAAVVGSSTNDKPDDCQQSVSNGQVYMNCNGTWYQPMQNGSQTQYTVVNPPH